MKKITTKILECWIDDELIQKYAFYNRGVFVWGCAIALIATIAALPVLADPLYNALPIFVSVPAAVIGCIATGIAVSVAVAAKCVADSAKWYESEGASSLMWLSFMCFIFSSMASGFFVGEVIRVLVFS